MTMSKESSPGFPLLRLRTYKVLCFLFSAEGRVGVRPGACLWFPDTQ